ncbi:unnamed protein product [Mytilus edulis]|uniref:Uncharacterized protein n=1 Tax=Mytilus edulis TaxID=6550 RepID=A0A8S3TVW2_MYTED|nr:unnamed protein product [Mytilus edulis]
MSGNCKEIEIPQNNRESEREGNEYVRFAFLKDVNNSESNNLIEALDLKDEKEATNTDDDKCAAFYKSVRDAEYNKLVEAYDKEKIIKEEKERKRISRDEEKLDSTEVISAKEVTDEGEYADFYKSVRDTEYNKLVEAYVKERIMKEEKEANIKTREQENVDSSEVISDEDECAAFYKSVRDAEYNKLVESYDKEKIIKEEKERNKITREQEKIKKQFEEFWKPAADIDSLRHVSQKRSKPSTKDINDNQLVLKDELKLDLSTLDDITEDEDIPDTSRTSDSEWFSISLSDTEETPRPHLRPFFSPLVEDIHVSTITSKTKESAKEIEVDFPSKPSSGFMGFRQWFCQLFCCHSKPDEDVDHCI